MKLPSVRNLTCCNILVGALVVFLGALGSHLPLENSGYGNIDKFEVAQKYHIFHVLVVLIQGTMMVDRDRDISLKLSMIFIMLGVLFFCGSLYAEFFFRFDALSFLTPIGGLLFVIGWVTFFVAVVKREKFA